MRRVGLRTRKRSGVRRRERLNAKHEMSGDTWIGESRKSLWRTRRRGERGDLNGRQWRCWNLEGGGGCGGCHRRRRNSRWRPWGAAGGSVREGGWRVQGRWEGEGQVVLTWLDCLEGHWNGLGALVFKSVTVAGVYRPRFGSWSNRFHLPHPLSLLPRTLLIRPHHPRVPSTSEIRGKSSIAPSKGREEARKGAWAQRARTALRFAAAAVANRFRVTESTNSRSCPYRMSPHEGRPSAQDGKGWGGRH
jgi:hypothetical protein